MLIGTYTYDKMSIVVHFYRLCAHLQKSLGHVHHMWIWVVSTKKHVPFSGVCLVKITSLTSFRTWPLLNSFTFEKIPFWRYKIFYANNFWEFSVMFEGYVLQINSVFTPHTLKFLGTAPSSVTPLYPTPTRTICYMYGRESVNTTIHVTAGPRWGGRVKRVDRGGRVQLGSTQKFSEGGGGKLHN